MSNEEGRDLQTASQNQENLPVEKSLKLTSNEILDLTGLSEGQIAELKQKHMEGMIDLKKKAEELKIDVTALDAALTSFTHQTAKATEAGASATISHTQNSAAGRTEVIIGNTAKAQSGKISRSATGEQDRTMWIVGIVAIAAVVIALIAFSGK